MMTTLKMLWVEDDFDTLKAAVLPLEKKGWSISYAASYQDALKLLEQNYDVFLVDLIIPQIGSNVEVDDDQSNDTRYLGLKLIEKIRKCFGTNFPVIAFSVVHDPSVNKALDELGVNFRFTKGTNVSNKELCQAIESTITR
jgi:CheY-like chemotaxis protein